MYVYVYMHICTYIFMKHESSSVQEPMEYAYLRIMASIHTKVPLVELVAYIHIYKLMYTY